MDLSLPRNDQDLDSHYNLKDSAYKYFLQELKCTRSEAIKYSNIVFNVQVLQCKYDPKIMKKVRKFNDFFESSKNKLKVLNLY